MRTQLIPYSWRPAALILGAALFGACASSASPSRRKVIIDQDAYGGPNLDPILMVIQDPGVEVVGITVESGDGWLKESVAGTLRMLELIGRTDIPVVPGATYPLLNSEEETRRWERLYGKLPYKGAWMDAWPSYNTVNRPHYHAADVVPPLREGDPTAKPRAEVAALFLARKTREAPGEITILALGPFTNIALAAKLDESFAANAKELVIMGGAFDPDASKVDEFSLQFINSPRVEFNSRWDPEAAKIMLHAHWRKITAVPTDATIGTTLSAAQIAEAGGAGTPASRYFAHYGAAGFPLWDETAAAVWLDPTLIRQGDPLAMDVDIGHGPNYGATLSWRPSFNPGLGEPVVTVVRAVDVPRLQRLFIDSMRRPTPALLAAASFPGAGQTRGADGPAPVPIAIPVLVVTTYESGKDRGDTPGELQFWAERQDLSQEIQVPGVDHPILTNGKGLYAMVSGTTSRCAVQIMALAADPRFDLTHTYFVLSGIGGGFPKVMSLASAVWVQTVVDGNPAFEIDSREIPANWSSGLVAIGATKPGEGSANIDSVPPAGVSENSSGGVGTVAFRLNPSLVRWAFELTKDVPIPDSEPLRAFGRRFEGYAVARRPPFVLMGDSIGSDRFFHGEIMARWAEDWDRIYTRGAGKLAISDCEDAGVCLAMQRLARMGRVDFNRLLILRTACNFTVPPTGVTAERSLFGDTVSDSSGVAYIPALEADYRIGSVVVLKLLGGWAGYRDQVP